MMAADTNVLLRYILKDDEKQFATAAAFFGARSPEDPAFICQIVLCEMAWTLAQRYKFSRTQITSIIEALLETSEIHVEDEEIVSAAIADASPTADFADLMIALRASMSGCSSTVTFDKGAAISVPGMELLA